MTKMVAHDSAEALFLKKKNWNATNERIFIHISLIIPPKKRGRPVKYLFILQHSCQLP